MNRLLGLSRYSKKLLFGIIIFALDIVAMTAILCFDVVELILISNNKTAISKLFLPLNIVFISLICISIIAIILIIIIFYVRRKSNGTSKN